MSVFFLFLAFALLFLFFQASGADTNWRRSFLLSAIVWSVFLVAVTEGLSLFGVLTSGTYIAAWAIADIGLLFVLVKSKAPVVKALRPQPFDLDLDEWFLVIGGALLLLVTLLVALLAPPNSWDAMTYHMPRVMQWMQNQTVAFFPTHNLRQIYMPPFAEYVILGFWIAVGDDQLSNLPQFFSMAGSAIAVSLIAQYFGANRRGQILAAIFALTLPTGILEASGAKNDYVLSFWMVTFVFLGLLWKKNPGDNFAATLSGLALGLALFTKGTAYVMVLPFIVWFGVAGIIALGKNVWRPVVIVALFSVVINASLYLRNIEVFDHPLGTMASEYPHLKPTNDIFTPAAFLSNTVRNATLHMGTPFHSLNGFLYSSVKQIHQSLLGIDINDPATTWIANYYVKWYNVLLHHENTSGDPVHFALIALLILFPLPSLYQRAPPRALFIYAVVTVASLCLILLLFKWTPQNARYHLPIFLLVAPFLGLILSLTKKSSFVAGLVGLILLLQAAPPALMNWTRPLIPITGPLLAIARATNIGERMVLTLNSRTLLKADRETVLFASRPSRKKPYKKATAFIASTGCHAIGFIADFEIDPFSQLSMEYQLWKLLRRGDAEPHFHFRHVNVRNKSVQAEPVDPTAPCALLKLHTPQGNPSDSNRTPPLPTPINVNGVRYERVLFDTLLGVYLPATQETLNPKSAESR